MLDAKVIKKDFPIFQTYKDLVYLDSAATTQKPRSMISAISSHYENNNANVHRGIYQLSEDATQAYIKERKKIASFIGAEFEEIIFTKNATEAVNLVAYSWARKHLKKGDNIVLTILEHHADIVPWQILSKEIGVELKFIDINDDGTLKIEEYDNKIDKNTKLVCVSHISNALGIINPIKKIIDLAHSVLAKVLIDACQSVPHKRIDVKSLDCDFLAFSGHKMLGPMGTGVLFGKEDVLQDMNPFLAGGDMIKEVRKEGAIWNDIPWKFEAGTPNVEGVIGLSAAISYLENIGMENIADHESMLLKYALEKINSMKFIKHFGSTDLSKRAGIISFTMDNIHSHDVSAFLAQKNICIRSGMHCAHPLLERFGISSTARASFYIYNTKEDIDKMCDTLEEVNKAFN